MSGTFRVIKMFDRSAEVAALANEALADGLELVTEACVTEANPKTPIETGHLESTGFAEVDREHLEGQVAYNTPYAVYQHETRDLHHDPGREDHWLSKTVAANEAKYAAALRATARRKLGGG